MRFFRKNTTKRMGGGRPVEREIGILFDIGALGTMYGKAAYRILFDSLVLQRQFGMFGALSLVVAVAGSGLVESSPV